MSNQDYNLWQWYVRIQECKQLSLTLGNYFQSFRVSDNLTLLQPCHAIRLLRLTPEVGASVHAGYVEDSYAL